MEHHKKIKIREGLSILLKEEEKNLPEIEKKIAESQRKIAEEKLRIEKEKEKFTEEMMREKEKIIREGIEKIERECGDVLMQVKEKAEKLVSSLDRYRDLAMKIFEEIILKEE